ncbi:MAG: triose-phosphate isomerase [Candidatus Eisenbacteria bacterium]|nr:triose-phosphate isomerase [Candidatus Eisenbacteria bacterium]
MLIAGNWKMHKTLREGLDLVQGLLEGVEDLPADRRVLICPPATLLHPIRERIGKKPLLLGGQDVAWEREGALTGEISPVMLLDAGCSHVIVGHSERRHVIGEPGERIRRKLDAALENGLRVIACIGETLEEREAGDTEAVLVRQLEEAFQGRRECPAENWLTVAYEPVWAIGTGKTATPDQAQEAHAFIRARLAERWGEPGRAVAILYGGSVKPDNAADILNQGDVDGVLVGGASLEAGDFLAIARAG